MDLGLTLMVSVIFKSMLFQRIYTLYTKYSLKFANSYKIHQIYDADVTETS